MTTSTPMRAHGTDGEVDVVVVGTGAGGAPLLAALAEAGLSVVALEAGAHHAPEDHLPDELVAGPAINWMDERLSGGDDPTAFGPNNSGRGVGGSTLHWGAFTPRPDPRDLRLGSDDGAAPDWPIDHAELISHIVEVERFLGISGPARYPWDPQRRYPNPPVARNAPAQLMQLGCDALGILATDAPAAVLSRPHEQPSWGTRSACVNCGTCHQGCRVAAKVSMDVSYLPLAVAHGAEIRAEATAHRIETDGRGRVNAVVYRYDGVDVRQRCRTLVLSAGGVETPRLLLANDLANRSGQVGRNFMAHGATQVWGRFDDEVRGHRGYPSALITEDFVRLDDLDVVGGYLLQSIGVMPATFATTLVRSGIHGAELVRRLDDYRFMSGIGLNAESLPADGNALVLSDELDELGVPKARITFSTGENEKAIAAHATERMQAILTAAGARETIVLDRTAHTLGTCRMGTSGDEAVVDHRGRSFDIDNLWICDNSTFPSSLTANPGLTQMALSRRTAQHLLAGR